MAKRPKAEPINSEVVKPAPPKLPERKHSVVQFGCKDAIASTLIPPKIKRCDRAIIFLDLNICTILFYCPM